MAGEAGQAVVARRGDRPGPRWRESVKVTMGIRIQDSADVSAEATIGDGSSVWHLAQVREGAVLGRNCIIGRGAMSEATSNSPAL